MGISEPITIQQVSAKLCVAGSQITEMPCGMAPKTASSRINKIPTSTY
jgi:hypothetical protein